MTGRSLTLEARYKMNEDTDNEQTMIQSLAVDVARVPTLKSWSSCRTAPRSTCPSSRLETNYTCRATAASVKIDAQAYTADGTTVTVNGKQTDTVNLSSGKNNVLVKVSHTGGQSRTYQIQIERVSRRHCGAGGPCGRGCGAAQPGRHGHCAGVWQRQIPPDPRRYYRVRFD